MNLSIFNSKLELTKFLKNLAWFSSILIVVNGFFLFTLNQIPQYSNYFKLTEPSSKVKMVILSDSRGNVIKDRMLPDTVANLSFGSDSYQDMLSKMSYALKNFPNLETIIITIDEHCFLSYRTKYNNTDKSILFADYDTYVIANPTNRVNFMMARLIAQWIPISSKKNVTLVQKLIESKFKSSSQTNENTLKSWCELSSKERAKLEEERFNFQFNTIFDISNSKTFNEIVKLAELRGIQVFGTKFPVTTGYKKYLDSKSFTEVNQAISESKIKILDFSNDQYDSCMFENQDHLNNLGAEILTVKLLSHTALVNP